jgi:dipeptidyl aminopeptidase/acylaminoacyl peptidase
MKKIGTLLAAFLACGVTQQPRVATIPRYRGNLTGEDARYITGMNYDPSDAPFAWLRTDEILIGHAEVYSSADVFSHTCAGSGFHVVSVANGSARPVAVGAPACDAVLSYEGAAADPEGRWVVYSAHVPPNNSRLLRLNLSTKAVDTLPTGCRIYHDQPAVSRDAAFIAGRGLCRGRDEDHYRIYVTAADGSGLRVVSTSDSASDEMPAWSPDGKHIAFERTRGVTTDRIEEIAIQGLNGSDRRTLTPGLGPAWSPDGQWIAFLTVDHRARRNQSLRIIRPDGSGEKVVFANADRGTYSRGWGPIPEGLPYGPLVWSPDSRWIVFTRRFDAGRSVWRVEIESGRVAQVTAPDSR